MAKLDKAIQKNDDTIIAAEEDFYVDVKGVEKKLLAEINKLFRIIDVSDGKIKTSAAAIEFLAHIEKRIDDALKKSGYNSAVMDLLKNFDTIRRNNLEIHSILNKADIPYSSLNAITKLEVENTIDKLLGAGISRDFKYPIREALYRNITLGTTIDEAKQTLESYLLSNDGKESKLLRYTTQVARDSVNQYDGAIQVAIKTELGLKDYIYSGSIIKDSRCQCRYWVEKQKLPHDELADEIETALAGGDLGGCTCSGMIPGTNVINFAVNRGGYSCRHRAIATNLKKS